MFWRVQSGWITTESVQSQVWTSRLRGTVQYKRVNWLIIVARPGSGSDGVVFLFFLVHAQDGELIKEKFQCNLLVSFVRILFLNWLYMNELD